MPRRAPTITQADTARVLRAYRCEGMLARVTIRPDGSVEFEPVRTAPPNDYDGTPDKEIVL